MKYGDELFNRVYALLDSLSFSKKLTTEEFCFLKRYVVQFIEVLYEDQLNA